MGKSQKSSKSSKKTKKSTSSKRSISTKKFRSEKRNKKILTLEEYSMKYDIPEENQEAMYERYLGSMAVTGLRKPPVNQMSLDQYEEYFTNNVKKMTKKQKESRLKEIKYNLQGYKKSEREGNDYSDTIEEANLERKISQERKNKDE